MMLGMVDGAKAKALKAKEAVERIERVFEVVQKEVRSIRISSVYAGAGAGACAGA